MSNIKSKKVQSYKVVRQWTNSFAQSCYELEDGSTIYIDYGGDRLDIIKGER